MSGAGAAPGAGEGRERFPRSAGSGPLLADLHPFRPSALEEDERLERGLEQRRRKLSRQLSRRERCVLS